MADQESKFAQGGSRQRIEALIRSGMSTSEILEETGLPLEQIKSVKSEVLPILAKEAREADEKRWKIRNAAKRERQHKEWLKKRGIHVPEGKPVVIPDALPAGPQPGNTTQG